MFMLKELKNSLNTNENATKNELERMILRERAMHLALNCGAIFERIPALLPQLYGVMACDLKFYNNIWSLNEGRPGYALARNEILGGNWSKQQFRLPSNRKRTFKPRYPSKEFLYDMLLRQEFGYGAQLDLDVIEQSLICVRMIHLRRVQGDQRVLKSDELFPEFAQNREVTMLLLRELYESIPQKERIIDQPFLVTGVVE